MNFWPFKRRAPAVPFEDQILDLPPVPCDARYTHYSWELIEGMRCPKCQMLKEQRAAQTRDEALAERIAERVLALMATREQQSPAVGKADGVTAFSMLTSAIAESDRLIGIGDQVTGAGLALQRVDRLPRTQEALAFGLFHRHRAAGGKGLADIVVTATVAVLATVAALFLNTTTPIRFIENLTYDLRLSGGAPAPDLAGALTALGRDESLGRIDDALSLPA